MQLMRKKRCVKQLLAFRPTPALTAKIILDILQPSFSEAGSNRRADQEQTYRCFVGFVKEAAGETIDL